MVSVCLLFACSTNEQESGQENQQIATSFEVEIIATGANIAGANGLAIGPDGNLYVTSVLGSSISVIDPETGEILKTLDAEDGVIGPDDVDFFKDGSYYWTSIMTGEVAGFDAEGNRVVAAQLTPGVNPITFSNDGRLFVSQCFFGTNLYEIDPNGEREARLISDKLGPGCGLNGMDWGPDNRLYGPRWFNQEVVSFDVDNNSMKTEATGFNTPAAVKFDKTGLLHVLDTGAGILYRMEEDEKVVTATLSPGLDNFAIAEDGRFFVTSFTDGFVKRINKDGSVTELQPGGIAHAGGITFFQDKVVLADLHAIRAYTTSGAEAFTQRNVLGTGVMGGALNIADDGDDLILTSWVDNDVRVWNQEEQRVKWRSSGLSAPVSAVRYQGLIAVAEHGENRVIGLNELGEIESIFAEELPAPTGLVAINDQLYVSDRKLGKILRIAVNGEPLSEPETLVGNLISPEGFDLYGEKFVVVEADSGEVKIVSALGEKTTIAKIPAGTQAASDLQPPSQVFNGVTVDDKGNVYVPGETNRALYKISNPF
tara:strand:- start:147 stop:1766 length:1620 start_codon:yes stop_codon:yes gene_type:complete